MMSSREVAHVWNQREGENLGLENVNDFILHFACREPFTQGQGARKRPVGVRKRGVMAFLNMMLTALGG